jgi:hypothetical protein
MLYSFCPRIAVYAAGNDAVLPGALSCEQQLEELRTRFDAVSQEAVDLKHRLLP